jgi:hypothetical protein
VLESPRKPLRDLVRRNIVTALENARRDALDRQFRGTDVQVIEKHPKAALLGLVNQLDLGGMREHGFRHETHSLPQELGASFRG